MWLALDCLQAPLTAGWGIMTEFAKVMRSLRTLFCWLYLEPTLVVDDIPVRLCLSVIGKGKVAVCRAVGDSLVMDSMVWIASLYVLCL